MVNPIVQVGNMLPQEITAANAAADGSGSIVLALTAGKNGSKVYGVTFRNSRPTEAASSAMLCKVFLSNTVGTGFKIIGEVALPSVTRSGTQVGAAATISFTPNLDLLEGQCIGVTKSIHVGTQDNVSVVVLAGDI